MTNLDFQRSAVDAGGAISSAWEMLKDKYGMYLGIAVIAIILTGCIPCINLFIMGPVMGGIAYVVMRDMRGEPVEFGMMFQGFQKFVPLMVIGLLQSIPGIIAQIFQYAVQFADMGLRGGRSRDIEFFQSSGESILAGGLLIVVVVFGIVFFILGILWWACFFFAIPLAMEHDLGAIDAIKLSARAAMGNLGGMIVVLLFTILVTLVGILALCIGVFLISIPVIYITNVLVYRQVFPMIDGQFNMSPPPPSAYGGGYGYAQG